MLRQITCKAFAHQNVTGVAAIHHPTRDINSYSGNVVAGISVPDVLHRSTVDPYPYRQAWLSAKSPTDFQGALGRPLH